MFQRIIITGPESSGKSTLFNYLKGELNGKGVKEYAREYLSLLKRDYSFDDFRHIVKTQLHRCQLNSLIKYQLLLCDTNALVLKVWAEERYNQEIPEIEIALQNSSSDVYLLCKPDLPWVADPLRENPLDRDRLFEVYLKYLNSYNINFQIVFGTGEERHLRALTFVNECGL